MPDPPPEATNVVAVAVQANVQQDVLQPADLSHPGCAEEICIHKENLRRQEICR